MSLVSVVLGVLAVWRVTHLLHAEDGPWNLGVRLRRAAGAGFFGQLLDCFYCLSLWVALPAALLLGSGWREGVLLWLGLSGGAILLERATAPPAPFTEDPVMEETHVLRTDETADRRDGGFHASHTAEHGTEQAGAQLHRPLRVHGPDRPDGGGSG